MKIICYGDSNTYGYDPRSYWGGRYGTEDRWVDILGHMLGCDAVNAGENGREIPVREGELKDFSQRLEQNKPVDMLLIMLGTNDLLQGNRSEAVSERMDRFLRGIDLPGRAILLIAPPPMKLGEWVPTESYIRASRDLAFAYGDLAKRLGVLFVDAGDWEVEMAFDGVHFTSEGHRQFADGLYHYLCKGE